MSAQSLLKIDCNYLNEKLDDYLIKQGLLFLNYYDYDLEPKPNYQKIDTLLTVKKLYDKNPKDMESILNKLMK